MVFIINNQHNEMPNFFPLLWELTGNEKPFIRLLMQKHTSFSKVLKSVPTHNGLFGNYGGIGHKYSKKRDNFHIALNAFFQFIKTHILKINYDLKLNL